METNEENRKEIRKNHLNNRKTHHRFADEEAKFANKSKKVRKYQLEALEQEELEEEWEEYLR